MFTKQSYSNAVIFISVLVCCLYNQAVGAELRGYATKYYAPTETARKENAIRPHSERKLYLRSSSSSAVEPPLDCDGELSMKIVCADDDDCEFDKIPGTCAGKMFQYHGGLCRNEEGGTNATSLGVSSCQDINNGPAEDSEESVFIVVTDVADPARTSGMWTSVGDYFGLNLDDYEVGDSGMSDTLNITIYRTNVTTAYDNMLQTMIFRAPCEVPGDDGNFLQDLDPDQPVQLLFTSVDAVIKANFSVEITSTNKRWMLQEVTLATNGVDPVFQELDVSKIPAVTASSSVNVPVTIAMDRHQQLSVLMTTHAVATGNSDSPDTCVVSDLHSFEAHPLPAIFPTTAPTGSSNNDGAP